MAKPKLPSVGKAASHQAGAASMPSEAESVFKGTEPSPPGGMLTVHILSLTRHECTSL